MKEIWDEMLTRHSRGGVRFKYPVSSCEASHTGGEMDDITTSIVNHTPLPQETPTPDAECTNSVRACQPQGHEHHPRPETHAPKHRSSQQHQCDRCKHELEVDQGGHGEEWGELGNFHGAVVVQMFTWRKVSLREKVFVAQCGPCLSPDGKKPLSEGHLVSPAYPAQEDSCEGIECHEGRIHCPLLLHYASVENHQSRHTLHAHKGAGCQLPCIVSLVQPVWGHSPRSYVCWWDRSLHDFCIRKLGLAIWWKHLVSELSVFFLSTKLDLILTLIFSWAMSDPWEHSSAICYRLERKHLNSNILPEYSKWWVLCTTQVSWKKPQTTSSFVGMD